jgi:hypothetical protein
MCAATGLAIDTSPKRPTAHQGLGRECDPGVESWVPAWATVRVGSKAEPRSGSECD